MIKLELTIKCDICGREYTETVENPSLRGLLTKYLPVESILFTGFDDHLVCHRCEGKEDAKRD